jgi:hypothetical protein
MSLLEDVRREGTMARQRVGRAPAKGKKKAKAAPKRAPKKAAAKSSKKDADKPRRKSRNTKPTIMDTSGIGIQPMLVKQTLVAQALNPLESRTKVAIKLAECRPAKPSTKPAKSSSRRRGKAAANPPVPAIPTPVSEMLPEHLRVIRAAEESYRSTLRTKYEKEVYLANLKAKNKEKYDRYEEERKKAHKEPNFDLRAFNEAFDSKFYGRAFERFVAEHDAYADKDKYDEWRRARILVTKMCLRTSRSTRVIIAAFLDLIVEQFARNGIQNCILTGKRIVQIWHALKETKSFDESVPLHRYVRTLQGYDRTLQWIREYGESRLPNGDKRNVSSSKLEFDGTDKFKSYVGNIVKSTRTRMSKGAQTTAEQNGFNQLRVGGNFKSFFSYVALETIVRIGRVLLCSVELNNVKTISDRMTMSAIKEMCVTCGVDFDPIEGEINRKLEQYAEWSEKRRELRKRTKEEKKSEPAEEEEEKSNDEEEESHHDEESDDEDEEEIVDLERSGDATSEDEDDVEESEPDDEEE